MFVTFPVSKSIAKAVFMKYGASMFQKRSFTAPKLKVFLLKFMCFISIILIHLLTFLGIDMEYATKKVSGPSKTGQCSL